MLKKVRWGHVLLTIVVAVCLYWSALVVGSVIDTNMHNDPFADGYQDFAEWNIFADID